MTQQRSPLPIAIRAGQIPNDVEFCAQLWVSALRERDGEVDEPVMLQRVRDAFSGSAERAGRIVRFAIATAPGVGFALLENDGGSRALLHYLAVHPLQKAPGVGSALLRDAIAHAQQAEFASVALEVRTNNSRAIEVYERFGFAAAGAPVPHPTAGYPMQEYVLRL